MYSQFSLMKIHLYNTLTRQTELFTPLKANEASIYACGPTVYSFAHIGNLRAYIFVDLLHRLLKFSGLNVRLVMNITDVGHLTDDGNDGEDKMFVAMRREGKTAMDIADFYTEAFLSDIKSLNILPAEVYPRATAHILEQIQMIEQLEKNGFTYQTSDGVYFDTSRLPSYGRLSRQKAEDKQAGVRVEIGEKRNATDFALWKFSPDGVTREMIWPSPWGDGFPGWHLECSAMSAKYLGTPFDIHTGGIDHIAVHHENELAQTEGATGKLEANVWMHNEFLTVDSGKMSKSLGNVYTLTDIVEHGFEPLSYRFMCLSAHYRTKLNFTWEALEAAQNALHKIRSTVRDWEKPTSSLVEFDDRFIATMSDDLKTSEAFAVMWEMINSEAYSGQKAATLLKMDQVLGLDLAEYIAKPLEVPPVIYALVSEREQARSEKRWADSDRLRNEIALLGFVVEDTAEGSKITEK